MATNPNRLIKLYKTGGTYTDDSWRENLSRIATAVDKSHQHAAEFITDVKDFAKNFDVDPAIDLLLTEDLPKFKTKNNWDAPMVPVIKSLNNETMNAINGALALFEGVKTIANGNWTDSTGTTSGTFMPWVQNIQAWNGASPLAISVTFKFAMGQYGLWNAREEVVKPILNLLAPTLPQHINAFTMSGNTPNSFNLISEMITITAKSIFTEGGGDTEEWQAVRDSWNNLFGTETNTQNILDTITTKIGEVGNVIGSFLEFLVLNAYKRYTYTIEFGNMFTLNRMIIKDATSWEFSKEVDQYGLPVRGSITLTMESMIPMAMSSSSKNNMFMRYKFQ